MTRNNLVKTGDIIFCFSYKPAIFDANSKTNSVNRKDQLLHLEKKKDWLKDRLSNTQASLDSGRAYFWNYASYHRPEVNVVLRV